MEDSVDLEDCVGGDTSAWVILSPNIRLPASWIEIWNDPSASSRLVSISDLLTSPRRLDCSFDRAIVSKVLSESAKSPNRFLFGTGFVGLLELVSDEVVSCTW